MRTIQFSYRHHIHDLRLKRYGAGDCYVVCLVFDLEIEGINAAVGLQFDKELEDADDTVLYNSVNDNIDSIKRSLSHSTLFNTNYIHDLKLSTNKTRDFSKPQKFSVDISEEAYTNLLSEAKLYDELTEAYGACNLHVYYLDPNYAKQNQDAIACISFMGHCWDKAIYNFFYTAKLRSYGSLLQSSRAKPVDFEDRRGELRSLNAPEVYTSKPYLSDRIKRFMTSKGV